MQDPRLLSLDDILKYSNTDVVARFSEDHHVSMTDSEDIFTEMKRWLWFSAKRNLEVESGFSAHIAIPLFNEARAIDLMWHTFLLYTKDYADFCERYFGFFLHHQPRPRSERLAWLARAESDPAGALKERQASLKKVYELIHDELGAATLVKWCEEFPARFKI